MPVSIELTEQEMTWAALIGVARHAESVRRGRRDSHGAEAVASGLALHIEGACGELAVAKWRGVHWGGHVGSFKGADLGARVQVRTRSRHDYDLIIRPDDPDDHCFILVTGTAPAYVLRGWVWGREGKRDEYVREHGGRPSAWFVPVAALRPMERTRQHDSRRESAGDRQRLPLGDGR